MCFQRVSGARQADSGAAQAAQGWRRPGLFGGKGLPVAPELAQLITKGANRNKRLGLRRRGLQEVGNEKP